MRAEGATEASGWTPGGPRRLIEERQRAGEIEIGIGRDELRGRQAFDRCGHQDGAGARVLHFVRVLGIGQEGELRWRRRAPCRRRR